MSICEMLQIAIQKQESENCGNIEYLNEGFLNLTLPSESVDVAISFFGVFQYLLKTEEHLIALDKIFRILKPNGFVLFDVMNYFSLIKKYKKPKITE